MRSMAAESQQGARWPWSLPRLSVLLTRPVFYFALPAFIATFFLPVHGVGAPSCPVPLVTGRPCLGCGMTRALTALSHGEFGIAWFDHPFSYLVWPVMAWLALGAVVPKLRRRSLEYVERRDPSLSRLAWTLFALFLAFGVFRFAGGYPAP